MTDLSHYTKTRAARDVEFADGLEGGYANFRIGVLLRRAREEAGLTQDEIARRLEVRTSAISRIENHASEIRLSILERYASALGHHLSLELRPDRRVGKHPA